MLKKRRKKVALTAFNKDRGRAEGVLGEKSAFAKALHITIFIIGNLMVLLLLLLCYLFL